VRILIVGAGAIGCLLAARLCGAGHEVAVVARGAHLEAMRARGLALEVPSGRSLAQPAACASVDEAPPAQAVFVTLKAHQLPPMAGDIARACRGAQVFIPVQNGIPWWYFQRLEGPHRDRAVNAVDPGGVLARTLPIELTVPAYAFLSAEVVAPGVVRHAATDKDSFPLGELQGDGDGPLARIAGGLLRSAGFEAPVVDVRQWAWNKLLGNVWANPIGALTRATVGATAAHPDGRRLALALMHEVSAVAAAVGCRTTVDFEVRLARGAGLKDARASMLQDVERGRRTEHEAILGALVELGALAGAAVPHADTLLACLRLADALTGRAAAANNVGNSVSQ
jgi:2-dehydropantoate 2-reductase